MSQMRFGFCQFSWAYSLKLALITGIFTFTQISQNLLAQGIPQRWEAQEYQPQSGMGKPRRITGAGTRGDRCRFTNKPPLTALVPANGLGVTVSTQPTFYVYVPARLPQVSPLQVEFRLKDKNDIDIYQTSFQTTGKPGIVAITLPSQAGLIPLELGQDYQWTFEVMCAANDHSHQMTVGGLVRRVELNPTLNNQIQKASPQKQVELYADAGMWQDALGTLMQLRRENPNDSVVVSSWAKLLSAVGLEDINQESSVQIPINSEAQLTSSQKFYLRP